MGFDEVIFKWKIKNFAIKSLDIIGSSIRSPSFKCFDENVHLQMSRVAEKIRLQLVYDKISLRLVDCSIRIYYPNDDKWYAENFKVFSNICFDRSMHEIEKDFIFDNVLTVGCNVTAIKLKHNIDAWTETQMNGNERSLRHNTLAENLGNLLEDSRLSDVTLIVGEHSFQAHKAILASRSKVFDGMFQSGMKESQESVVKIIGELKPETVKELLYYIYTGETAEKLSMEQIIDLYVAADRYDLQVLKEWCRDFILKNLSSDDVCRVTVIADLHSDEELAKKTKHVFKNNSKLILVSESWRAFGKTNPALQTALLESALLS